MQRMSPLTIGQGTFGDETTSSDQILRVSRSPDETEKSVGDFNGQNARNKSQDNFDKQQLNLLSNGQTKSIRDISDTVNVTRVGLSTDRQKVISQTVDQRPDWITQKEHTNITLGDCMTERAWHMQQDPSCRQRRSPSSNRLQMPLTDDVADRNDWQEQQNSSADRAPPLPRKQSTFGTNTSESNNIPLVNSSLGEQKTSSNGMPRRVSCESDLSSRTGWSLPRPRSSPSRIPSNSSGDAPGWGVLNSSPKVSHVSTKSYKGDDSIWGPHCSSTRTMNGKLFDSDNRWATSSLDWQYPKKMPQKNIYGPVGWGLPRACSSPSKTSVGELFNDDASEVIRWGLTSSPVKICSPPTDLLQSSLLNEINTTKPITDDASKSSSSPNNQGNSSPTILQQVCSSSTKSQSEFSVNSAYDVWGLPRASSPSKANSSPSVTCGVGTSDATSTWGVPQSLFRDKIESSWSMPVGSSPNRTGSFYGGITASESTMWGMTNSSPAQGDLATSDPKIWGVSQTSPKMQRYNSSPLINSDVNESSAWKTLVTMPPDTTLTSITVHSRVTSEVSTRRGMPRANSSPGRMPRAHSPTDPISRYSPLEAATYYSLLGDETSEPATYWRISKACSPPGRMSRVDSPPGATSRSNSHSGVASNASVNTQSAKSLGTSRPNSHSGVGSVPWDAPRVRSPPTTSPTSRTSQGEARWSMDPTTPQSTKTPAFVPQHNVAATSWSLPQETFGSLQGSSSNLNHKPSERDFEVKNVPGVPRASTSPMRGPRLSTQHRFALKETNFPLSLNGVACSSSFVARKDTNCVNVSNRQNSANRPQLNLQEPQITPHIMTEPNNITRDPIYVDASNRISLTSTNRPQIIHQEPQMTAHIMKEHNITRDTNYVDTSNNQPQSNPLATKEPNPAKDTNYIDASSRTSLTSPIRPQMNPELTNWGVQRMNQYRMQQINPGMMNVHTFHSEYSYIPRIPLYRLPQINSSATRLPNMSLYNIGAGDVANSWGLPRMTQSTLQGSVLGRGTAGWGVPRVNQPWGKQ